MSDKHFELTDETVVHNGVTLHRIRATRDLPDYGVTTGDLGGYVESMDNLEDRVWVADNAKVYGNARIEGRAYVCENACVYGFSSHTRGVFPPAGARPTRPRGFPRIRGVSPVGHSGRPRAYVFLAYAGVFFD